MSLHLSTKLNSANAGCSVGNLILNHLKHADDLCCFAASASGLQDLLNICSEHAEMHDLVFNCKKIVGMIFFGRRYVHIYTSKC